MNAPPTDDLLQRARALLIRTMTFYRDDPRTSSWLRERLERLDEPLRIAVTGRVKSGKSALINALVGHELAPTDPEERTQVNTFYRYGPEPKITVHTPHGAVQNIPTGSLDIGTIRDLQRWRPDEIARLVIESPTPGLQALTLIETPGVSSSAVQETGRSALAQILSEADAVLYLTRYPHHTDLQFLQSVHELEIARRAPINTILALSRADETGSGGGEALPTAEKIARRNRDDPRVQAFAQHVIPVVGLLGQAAGSMTPEDLAALTEIARLPETELRSLLLSADRFANSESPESVSPTHRQQLLQRFGHFGVQQALTSIRDGSDSHRRLRSALLDASRMNELQESLHRQFVERHRPLRARSVLLALDMVLRANPRPGIQQIRGEFERMVANSHEWAEMRLLSALDSGQVRFSPELYAEARRVCGGTGAAAYSRLGQDPQSTEAMLAHTAGEILARWRDQAVNPTHDRIHRDAVRTIVQTCERLISRQVHS